jgi:hypothetical protein
LCTEPGLGAFSKRLKFWGPKPPIWSEPESSFFEELKRSLEEDGYDPSIAPFLWPGANSVIERDLCAQFLAKKLDEQAEAEPEARQIVIGHSHGGNIILSAARHYRIILSAARHYRRTSTPIYLITMATPFLDLMLVAGKFDKETHTYPKEYIKQFNFISAMKNLKAWLLSVLIPFLLAAVLARLGYNDTLQRGSFFLGWFMTYLILYAFFLLPGVKYDKVLEHLPMFDTPPGPGASSIKLLVLRGIDDEASLALAAGSINRLLAASFVRLLSFLIALIATFWAAFFALAKLAVPDSGVIYFTYGLASLAVIFLLVSGLEAVSASAFGKEFFSAGAMVRIYSHCTPDSVCEMKIVTLPGPTKRARYRTYYYEPPEGESLQLKSGDIIVRERTPSEETLYYRRASGTVYTVKVTKFEGYSDSLRHSLYEHKDCVPSILAWLTGNRPHDEHDP